MHRVERQDGTLEAAPHELARDPASLQASSLNLGQDPPQHVGGLCTSEAVGRGTARPYSGGGPGRYFALGSPASLSVALTAPRRVGHGSCFLIITRLLVTVLSGPGSDMRNRNV